MNVQRTTLVLLGALALVATASAQDVSVADLARKHNTSSHARVITNDDLPGSSQPDNNGQVSDPDGAKAKPAADAKADNAADDGADKDKAKPSAKSGVARAQDIIGQRGDQIKRAETEIARLQSTLDTDGDPAHANAVRQLISSMEHNIAMWKSEQEAAQSIIDATSGVHKPEAYPPPTQQELQSAGVQNNGSNNNNNNNDHNNDN